MTWAKPKDVTDAWIGDNAPDDDAKLQIWIDKAEREILDKVPDIQERIDAQAAEDPPRTKLFDDAVDVTVAMVMRVFRNPEGQRSVSDSLGTGPLTESSSVTFGGDNPGALELTDRELEKLRPVARRGAFEVDLLAGYQGPSW